MKFETVKYKRKKLSLAELSSRSKKFYELIKKRRSIRDFDKSSVNDEIIIGTFGFCDKNTFVKSIQFIIKKNIRINNEFYLDVSMQQLLKLNHEICKIRVKNYISYGTPKEISK